MKPTTSNALTVIDFETTGQVDGHPDAPWQIGLVRITEGRLDPATLQEYLLHVGDRPFSPHAPGRHHALREELATAPELQELWPRLRTYLETDALVAHNIPTEKRVLLEHFPLFRPTQWIDTLKLSRQAWPGRQSYRLEDLTASDPFASRLQELCPGREAHDALYDACASALLLETLLRNPAWGSQSIDQLG